MDITPYITDILDFPQKGVVFKDISLLLKEKFPELIEHLHSLCPWNEIDYVVGIESRGFILGSALAQRGGVGFIPIRKKGKLPPPVLAESYSLEYGEDILEIKPSQSHGKILIVDDVLATGGTLKAAINLCEKAQYQVVQSLVLINLRFLNDLARQGVRLQSVLDIS